MSSIMLDVSVFHLLLWRYFIERSTFTHVVLMFVKWEIRDTLLPSSSNVEHMCVFICLATEKIEVMRRTSHTSTDEVRRSFHRTLHSISDTVEFILLVRLRFLIRLDRFEEKSSFITCGWKQKLELKCPHSHFHFSGRQVLLCVDAIEILFFDYVQEKSLQHCCPLVTSGSNVFDLYTSCPSFFFSWALKLDDIPRRTRGSSWSWTSRVNTTVRLDSTRAKLSLVSIG